jgi:predicted DNA-binding transcriptional regulator AlpA
MKDSSIMNRATAPMLFPYEPEKFLESIRQIVREEAAKAIPPVPITPSYSTPGMLNKPLYKMSEVCSMFQISKPTVYDWVRHGKLKPFKVRSRVFFLWQDIQKLLPAE